MIRKIGNLYSFKGEGRALLIYTDKYEKGYGTFTDLLSVFRNAIHSWDELREPVTPRRSNRRRIIKNLFRMFKNGN